MTSSLRLAGVLLAALLLHGCKEPAPPAHLHYVLGTPYQVGGVWFYPAESYSLSVTGLASVLPNGPARLTTDGEVFDQTAMAAAHPTIQLPAIARITNLQNGQQVTVRINDRGTGDPGRVVQLTSRAATLLGIPADGVAQVRLEVLQSESRAAVGSLPGAPSLAVTTAPRQTVESTDLAPPSGIVQAGGHAVTTAAADVGPTLGPGDAPPLRLPETVTQTAPQPGQLMVWLDAFSERSYALRQQAKMADANPSVVAFRQDRLRLYRAEIGPIANVATADSILRQALARGIPDAHIVVN
jgi:rare lipoprotein A